MILKKYLHTRPCVEEFYKFLRVYTLHQNQFLSVNNNISQINVYVYTVYLQFNIKYVAVNNYPPFWNQK